MELKNWLKHQMEKHNTNALGLSYAIKVSHVTIGKWLSGTYTPKPSNCRKLAQYFGAPEDYVLSLAGHRHQIKEEQTHYSTTNDVPGLREAMQLFSQLNDDDQERILIFMRSILQERRRARSNPSAQEGPAPA